MKKMEDYFYGYCHLFKNILLGGFGAVSEKRTTITHESLLHEKITDAGYQKNQVAVIFFPSSVYSLSAHFSNRNK
jgi:hypothetical protein